jgi:hypothetical protein
VDVRKIDAANTVAGYICKYVTKPASYDVLVNKDWLDEMMMAMAGRKLCLTWGSWRGKALDNPEPPPAGWIALGSLERLEYKIREGEQLARTALVLLIRKYPRKQWPNALLEAAGMSPP